MFSSVEDLVQEIEREVQLRQRDSVYSPMSWGSYVEEAREIITALSFYGLPLPVGLNVWESELDLQWDHLSVEVSFRGKCKVTIYGDADNSFLKETVFDDFPKALPLIGFVLNARLKLP